MSLDNAFHGFNSLNFWKGFILVVLGSTFQALGVGVQKYLRLKNESTPFRELQERFHWWSREWFIAMVFILLGALMDFTSLMFLPVSVAIPLSGAGLITSNIFAIKYFRQNPPHLKSGVILIILGAGGATLLAHKSPTIRSYSELANLLLPRKLSGIFVILLGCSVLMFAVIHRYSHKKPLISALIAGCLGGLRTIGAKGLAELFAYSRDHEIDEFNYIFSWCYLFTTIVIALAHMRVTHQEIVRPIYSFTASLLSVAAGVIFFGEWIDADLIQCFIMFSFLCGFFAGAYLLSKDFPFEHVVYDLVPGPEMGELRLSSGSMFEDDVDFDVTNEFLDSSTNSTELTRLKTAEDSRVVLPGEPRDSELIDIDVDQLSMDFDDDEYGLDSDHDL